MKSTVDKSWKRRRAMTVYIYMHIHKCIYLIVILRIGYDTMTQSSQCDTLIQNVEDQL